MTYENAKDVAQELANETGLTHYVIEGYDRFDRMVWDVTEYEPDDVPAARCEPQRLAA